jgi:hydroxymethylbilane synthase
MVPAPGQGALAVECRADDAALAALLATVDHPATRAAVTAERSLLAALEAGCSAPVGAFATCPGNTNLLHLEGIVLGTLAANLQPGALDSGTATGRMVIRERSEADAVDAARLGRELAERMLALGAAGLLRTDETNGNDADD